MSNKKTQDLQTTAAVEPASTAVVTFTAEGTSFVESISVSEGAQVVRISAPNVDRPVAPGPQGLLAAVADGFTLPKTAQLTLVLQNVAPDVRVLGVKLGLIDLDAAPIPFGQMGNLSGVTGTNPVRPGVTPQAISPAAAAVVPVDAQVPVRAQAPTMADIARMQNPGVPLNVDGTIDTSQLPDDTVLQPMSNDGKFQQYKPVIRYPGDRRPPPAKTAAMGGPQVRVVGPGAFVGNAVPGQPGPGVAQRPGAVVVGGNAMSGQNPAVVGHAPVAAGGLRNPVDVRGPMAQVTPDPRPSVVVTGPNGQPVSVQPIAYVAADASGEETTGKYPVVLKHPVAKSVWRMLQEKLPITKMHRDAVNGALAHAQSIPREPYYGEGNRQRLWNNGNVVAWLAPKNLGALHRLMAMGQGTGTGPVDHDALPDLVEAFQNALANPFTAPIEPVNQFSVPGNTPAQHQISPEAIPPPA